MRLKTIFLISLTIFTITACKTSPMKNISNNLYKITPDGIFWSGNEIVGADSASFEILATHYAKDENHVFTGSSMLADANPLTFNIEKYLVPKFKFSKMQPAKKQFFDLINKMTGNREMTKEDLEEIIKTDLIKDNKLSNEYFAIYKSKSSDIFNEIEFRKGDNKFILILHLSNANNQISETDILVYAENYIPVPQNPNEKSEIKYVMKYNLLHNGKISFQIRKDKLVDSVIIDYLDSFK